MAYTHARPLRFLGDASTSTSDPDTPNSDFVVVLAALLCALICTLGLIAVARCAWLRRRLSTNQQQSLSPPSTANKGLKKKIIRVLPKHIFSSSSDETVSVECPICLDKFVDGDEIRALPLCRHEFHVVCVDTWLQSHSSCPSCRRILTVERCEHCGQFASDSSGSSSASCSDARKEARVNRVNDDTDNRFLP